MTNPNQNIDFASNLIASGPVDWVTPLAQFYKDDEEKRRRHGQLLEKQDAQRAAAIKSGSVVDLVSKVAKFSAAARKMKASIDKNNAQREVEDNKEVQQAFQILGSKWAKDFQEKSYLEHEKTLRDLNDDEQANLARITKSLTEQEQNGDPMAAWGRNIINNAKGSSLIYAKSVFARSQLPGLTRGNMFIEMSKAELEAYDKAGKEGNLSLQNSIFGEWQRKKLGHLDLSPQTYAAVIGKGISKQRSTHDNIAKANAVSLLASEKNLKALTEIKAFAKSGNLVQGLQEWTDLKRNSNEHIDKSKEGGLTVHEQIKDELNGHLEVLVVQGDIPMGDLTEYFKTEVDNKDGSGKITLGELYFGKERVGKLIKLSEIGATRKIEVGRQRAEVRIPQLKAMAEGGQNVTEEAQNLLNKYPEFKEQIEDIQNTKPWDNQTTVQVDDKYTEMLRDGSLTLASLKNETNKEVLDKWTPIAEKIEKQKERWNTFKDGIDNEVVLLARKKSFDKTTDSLTNDESLAATILSNYANTVRADLLLNQKESGLSDGEIQLKVVEAVEGYRSRNGWGTENGLFGITKDKGTNTWTNLRSAYKQTEKSRRANLIQRDAIVEAQYEANLIKDEPDVNKRIEKGIYNREMLLDWRENAQFSVYMKDLAANHGTLPSVALDKTIAAIGTTTEGKLWLQNNNFQLSEGEEQADVKLMNTLIEKAEDAKGTSREASINQIRSILRWYGWDHLNIGQREQVYEILQEASPVTEGLVADDKGYADEFGLHPMEILMQKLRAEGRSEEEIRKALGKRDQAMETRIP